MIKKRNISIIGDGSWGTTLSIYLNEKGFNVTLWSAFSDYAKELKEKRKNYKYLPKVKIPDKINITSDIDIALDNSDILVLAIPSKFMREVLSKFKEKKMDDKYLISVTKGIEENTFKRMSEVIKEVLCLDSFSNLGVLSGPTIAYEIAFGKPAAAVIVSENKSTRLFLQEIFNSSRFRIYTNDDIIGVEICGALKNIIAIAAGISEGLDFGVNTKSALITRAMIEIARFGEKLGASSNTFNGLAGIGDLITTCFSKHSRNRTFGENIAKGKKTEEIINNMDMIVEGITTTRAVYEMSKKLKIDLPITTEVYEVIYKNKPPIEAVNNLMTREVKSENC